MNTSLFMVCSRNKARENNKQRIRCLGGAVCVEIRVNIRPLISAHGGCIKVHSGG